ncbi:MAG TPA: nuclear transport factor 2 family protein [Acidimicrobiales bacterium]|jgi:ketosteroid isomerase-like protein|nr:nuclear transport factor 2 family protein [Acidimicrobiales bacterium]
MARSKEVEAAVAAYVDLRERIERGEATWTDLAGIFTDDAVFIDPAYGRVEGLDAIRIFLDESMRGLEDWRFPIEFTAVDGDNVVIKWTQVLPNGRLQSGYSRLIYAGDGKFRYEEDQLNMVHVLSDMKSMRWRPAPDFVPPPAEPNRDFSVP